MKNRTEFVIQSRLNGWFDRQSFTDYSVATKIWAARRNQKWWKPAYKAWRMIQRSESELFREETIKP